MSVTKTCPVCKKQFSCRPSHAPKKTYCSKKCMAKDYQVRMVGDNNPNYRGAGFRLCANCGMEFHSYDKKHRFCSIGCYQRSAEKRENARKANDGQRKPKHPCKKCGEPTMYNRIFCPSCNPNKSKRIGHCLNCDRKVQSAYDVQFCQPCRETGVHKNEVFSICQRCGDRVLKYGRKYCDACFRISNRLGRGTPRKKDANQNEIVQALEKAGCSVMDASAVGGGFPDLIVGRPGVTYLIEIKNPRTKGKLNKLQQLFFDNWKGQAAVAHTIEEALAIVGLL